MNETVSKRKDNINFCKNILFYLSAFSILITQNIMFFDEMTSHHSKHKGYYNQPK